jgi:hypothetical protein
MSRHPQREHGFAMIVVMLAVGSLVLIVALVFRNAEAEYRDAQMLRRSDSLEVAADAMLQRYAAKMTLDPLYYLHYVDQAEAPRHCTDATSSGYDRVVQPGGVWYPDCRTWDYRSAVGFFYHPLLDGEAGTTADDIGTLIGVVAPAGDNGLEVTVVATQTEFGRTRAIAAQIRPEAVSEFAFFQEQDLRLGSGVSIRGKVYVGANLDFSQTSPRGVVYKNIYAEGYIGRTSGYGPPTFADGALGYDSSGNYLDIRSAYPNPISFDGFWDDLEVIREVACNGSGLCLSRTRNPGLGLTQNPTAFLVQPLVEAGVGRVKVWVSYNSNTTSCLTNEEWWWINSNTATWTLLGTYNMPATGVVWSDAHIVVGRPTAVATVKGALTVYAGSLALPKNVIIGSDVLYSGGLTGNDVIGLIGADEVYLSPSAVGSDKALTINGAILSQGGILGVPRSCGTDGNLLTASGSTLTTNGGIAKRSTGDLSSHFSTRNYNFDPRLVGMRPPFFPLVGDSWSFSSWRQVRVPCWAGGACP